MTDACVTVCSYIPISTFRFELYLSELKRLVSLFSFKRNNVMFYNKEHVAVGNAHSLIFKNVLRVENRKVMKQYHDWQNIPVGGKL